MAAGAAGSAWPGTFPEPPTATALPPLPKDDDGGLRLTVNGCVLDSIGKLGGSAESCKMQSRSSTACYVAKRRLNPEQCALECMVNRLYNGFGVPTPRSWVHEQDGKTYVLQEWIEGRVLSELKKHDTTAYEVARKACHDGLALDMLFANYDVIGNNGGDNILYGADGTVWRVDNAGSMWLRARGERKTTWVSGTDGKAADGSELISEHLTFTGKGGPVANKHLSDVFHDTDDACTLRGLARFWLAKDRVLGAAADLSDEHKGILEQRFVSLHRQLKGWAPLLVADFGVSQDQATEALGKVDGSLPLAAGLLAPDDFCGGVRWQCAAKSGWKDFPAHLANAFEYARRYGGGDLVFKKIDIGNPHRYDIDLKRMKQVNVSHSDHTERDIQRQDSPGGGSSCGAAGAGEVPTWYVKTDKGWAAYKPPDCAMLEQHLMKHGLEPLKSVPGSWSAKGRPFTFMFDQMVQINDAFKTRRDIRREGASPAEVVKLSTDQGISIECAARQLAGPHGMSAVAAP